MSREMDIIIFGATGFTGKHCIPVIHKLASNRLTWGVAGRSESKLKEILKECEKKTGGSMDKIPVVIADVSDQKSLEAMASRAKIIINCCGPYRFYGEPVVEACVAQSTHHVDVSGEPQYMEKMQLKYHKQAQEKGIYLLSACGFDSIPTDLGVIFVQQNFPGTVNSVETFLEAENESDLPGPSINYGTWESAVYGLSHAKELKGLRSKLYPQRLPLFTPTLKLKASPHKVGVVEGWAVPFLGSDRSVVKRSQRYLYDEENARPVQIETYLVIKSSLNLVLMMIFGALFATLARFEFGRKLLLNYPGFFSAGFFGKGQPSEEKVAATTFSVTLYAEGWTEKMSDRNDKYTIPVDKALVAKVKGRNPAYGATCVALVQAAITVITETDKMPSTGGVYAPGAAFAKTSLIQKLNENGLTFEVVAEKDL